MALASPEDVEVVSPLEVAGQSKLSLILDLRYVNSFLSKQSFRYEGIRTASDIFRKGDFMFIFDLKSAYHHVEIAPAYRKCLGFRWRHLGKQQHFVFVPYLLV